MKNQITKNIALIVILASIAVMVGWFFDIPTLKSILPHWVTMKFTTALSFFFAGVILYFVANSENMVNEWAQIHLSISSLVILLFMTTLLLSSFLNIRTGVEDLFISETKEAILTTIPGRPSVGAMVNFILIAFIAILTIFNIKRIKLLELILGSTILFLGLISVLGYVINQPAMYYSLEGISTAMAIHTSILFMIIGIGFILTGTTNIKKNIEE
jgi:succinate dehydrogenase hydrophobic anchor subunit